MGQTQVQTWFAVGQTCVRPRSDPDQTQVRPELSQSTVLRGELDTSFLLKSRSVQENSCNYLVKYLIFPVLQNKLPNIFKVACESRQFRNPEFI